ncbi:hypothetical protein [Sphingomonas endolithica]|uniref:hypothetical protein n=1 Tax=Sphingomonas endolithica TaxID=2972485 RepID=UPI0021B0020F|nr:hypothetical protein [Sphingomonas sp. ZFBP2030]
MTADIHPVTPDGRYFVVRGRLWRRSNPALSEEHRAALVGELMHARRAVGVALRQEDQPAVAEARAAVDRAKVALGERGPVWWHDGAPDLNRRMVANTLYAAWFEQRASISKASPAIDDESG